MQHNETRYRGAIWTLMLLAPVIAEVLSGSTRLSFLFVLLPEMLVWGVGALLCRELARRWNAGWVSLMLLGCALAAAEEFLIQQTSIAPLPFAGANAAFGRWGRVNWAYFLFMFGYESVWVVLIPVKVTELLFPRSAYVPWLRLRGAIVSVAGFLLGCRVAWYGWVKQARPRLGAAPYDPPMGLLVAGVVAVAVLIALAWLVRSLGLKRTQRRIVPAWAAGGMTAIAAAAWFLLLGQNFQTHPQLNAWQAVGCEIAIALGMFALFAVWTGSIRWSARYEWTVCFGALLGTVVVTSLQLNSYTLTDAVFKCVVDGLALIGMLWLGVRVWERQRAT